MNNTSKQKWMVLVLVLLLASNIATLVYLWFPPKQPLPMSGRGGFDLLVKELKMTDSQQAAYAKLRDEHQATVRPLRAEMRNAKDAFFELLKNDTVSQATVEAAAAKPAAIQQQLDVTSFQHFKKLRAICTAEQQDKFDNIIQDVLRQIGPGGGGPGGPPPPGGPRNRRLGDGPPDSLDPNSPPHNGTDNHPDGPPQDGPPPHQ